MNKNYLNNVRLRERRLSAHQCLACGKQLEEDYTSIYCEACREKRNKNAREERKWYQGHKICPRCRRIEIGPSESCCPECRAKLCANVMKNRKREQYNEEHAVWSKKAYANCVENGICTRCRKRKADNGYRTCGICREKDGVTRQVRNNAQFNREIKEKQGLCCFCNEKALPGYRVCQFHYDMCIDKLKDPKCVANRKKSKLRSIKF